MTDVLHFSRRGGMIVYESSERSGSCFRAREDMSMEKEMRAVHDLNHMAALEYSKVYPARTERIGSRVTGFYPKDKADKVINRYETGLLKAPMLEVMSALRRVKDRIFETERATRVMR